MLLGCFRWVFQPEVGAAPFRLTMVTSVRALKRHLMGLIWYIKGWILIELFLFLFEITKKILFNVFFWEFVVLRMRSSHFFLEKGLGDGYMRTPILTRFTQHHLRSWGCDPLYQQFWQMKKGQNAWHWALPLHILHWGKSTPQMLNQWRFRSRQAGCWRRHFILYLAWIGHDFRCHSVFLNDKKVPDKWSWWDQWELPGVLLCIEFINNSDMAACERLNCCGGQNENCKA